MKGYGADLDEYLRRQRLLATDMQTMIAEWRQGVFAKIEAIENQEANDRRATERSGQQENEIPKGAPPAYRRVREMVVRGELDWFDVITGEHDDSDVRTVHMWLEPRLDVARRALLSIRNDMTSEEAIEALEAVLGGQTPSGDTGPTSRSGRGANG